MQLTCPNCNYSKQIDPAHLPATMTRATCPKCQEKFQLPKTEPQPVERVDYEPRSEADLPQDPLLNSPRAEIEALPKAGFWLRVVAAMIDGVVVFALQFVLGLLLALAGFAASTGAGDEVSTVVILFGYVLGFAYYIVFTGHGGQTPGKMALRIKVICRDGSDIRYGRAAFREVVGKFISGIILCIGYLMVAFDEQKQGLHDRMAETYVIKL